MLFAYDYKPVTEGNSWSQIVSSVVVLLLDLDWIFPEREID